MKYTNLLDTFPLHKIIQDIKCDQQISFKVKIAGYNCHHEKGYLEGLHEQFDI